MYTAWKGTEYGEADRGKFEAWFLRGRTAIAYTDGGTVVLTSDYRERDKAAVQEFADQYDCEVEW